MLFVIPMAGKGERFFKAGYSLPKYMIEVKAKTLFEYSLLSLPLDLAKKVVFIGLKEHEDKYNLTDFINKKVQSFDLKAYPEIILLEKVTRGQAETVLMAQDHIEPDEDLLIYNIDTYFQSQTLRRKLMDKKLKKDGVIGAFRLENPDNKWSYAKLNEKNEIIETAEKVPISNYALTGMYHFTKAVDFLQIAGHCVENNIKSQNEFYIAPMYNELIRKGKGLTLDVAEEFTALGTPQDIENLKSNHIQ